LDIKTKESMVPAIGIVVRCDRWSAFQVYDALKASASEDEIVEPIGAAIMMGGGPAAVYGSAALEALKQFQQDY
jgi:alkylhydroperoxidase/carboxymuconolactone decarboxylase family protein YurZ